MGDASGRDVHCAALFAADPRPRVVMTPDMVIIDVNRAYLRVVGRERDELIGRRVMDAFPAETADRSDPAGHSDPADTADTADPVDPGATAVPRGATRRWDAARYPDAAVRYLPAIGSANACGDWYELADLGDDRLAVAVGDVVGHGLGAAAVMGRLRSALSAAIRAVGRPARALEVLGVCACSIDGALATTVVQMVIDRRARTITYSCAGHLPPVLLQPGDLVVPLDEATDPPLGVWPRPGGRPQARVTYEPGATLVLYTDGLVERRGEDIDVGLHRLTDSLVRHGASAPEPLADALLGDLGVAGGAADDTALVVIRL